MKLSNDAVVFFEKTGWYISEYYVSEDDIRQCTDAAERIYRCEYEHIQPWSTSPYLTTFNCPYDRRTLRVDQFPSFHSDSIRRLVHSREIAQMAANLLKTNEIRYYKDILIGTPREADDSSIGWHKDSSYWPTCLAERMITAYVPLQDRDESTGTLLMISGSQNWVSRAFNITAGFHELEKVKRHYEAAGHAVELHALQHKRGQVSFHSSLVVHATFPNVTENFQHSIVFGLQAAENRFVASPLKRFNPTLMVNLNDELGPKLSNGNPDLREDTFYPVLFREGS